MWIPITTGTCIKPILILEKEGMYFFSIDLFFSIAYDCCSTYTVDTFGALFAKNAQFSGAGYVANSTEVDASAL